MIYEFLSAYCKNKGIKIDIIVPIMRGGGVLGVCLSHLFSVIRMYPCQYKFVRMQKGLDSSTVYAPKLLLSTLGAVENKNDSYVVLITEGNHVHGEIAQECINLVKNMLPNARILYACIGCDYAHRAPLANTSFECCGFTTNETESLTLEECRQYHVKEKIVVYPWENLAEELKEVIESSN